MDFIVSPASVRGNTSRLLRFHLLFTSLISFSSVQGGNSCYLSPLSPNELFRANQTKAMGKIVIMFHEVSFARASYTPTRLYVDRRCWRSPPMSASIHVRTNGYTGVYRVSFCILRIAYPPDRSACIFFCKVAPLLAPAIVNHCSHFKQALKGFYCHCRGYVVIYRRI